MMISFNKIVLRDQTKNDIDDEIRWMTEETGWIKADTPWEPVIQIDPEQLKKQMMQNISRLNPGSVRNRLEITVAGRHIGFVSVYPFESSAIQIPVQSASEKKAVGIEICEPAFRNRGYGTDALRAWIHYCLEQSPSDIYLETWSGNTGMIRCAEKCGFMLYERQPEKHMVDGHPVDVLIYRLNNDKQE